MPAARPTTKPLGYTKAAHALRAHADPRKAKVYRWYFKHVDDDIFLGVTTPILRSLAREFYQLPLTEIRKLMRSGVHEERSLAGAVLRRRYEKGGEAERAKIFDFYVHHRRLVRSWDTVDDTAPNILGAHLLRRDKKLLYQLACSPNLWERRMAIVATLHFIRHGQVGGTIKLAKILLHDQEDLIHKATGWMLREIGKRDLPALKKFLKTHCRTMPRTMLRYAIERLPERERVKYLRGEP
jgi:3-methyladenine DNA glycosylase AlkD